MFTLKERVLVAVTAKVAREISEYLLKERVLVAVVAKVARKMCEYFEGKGVG